MTGAATAGEKNKKGGALSNKVRKSLINVKKQNENKKIGGANDAELENNWVRSNAG